MIPFLYAKKIGRGPKEISSKRKAMGAGLLTAALTLQGVFSSGLGSLVTVILVGFLGMSAFIALIFVTGIALLII